MGDKSSRWERYQAESQARQWDPKLLHNAYENYEKGQVRDGEGLLAWDKIPPRAPDSPAHAFHIDELGSFSRPMRTFPWFEDGGRFRSDRKYARCGARIKCVTGDRFNKYSEVSCPECVDAIENGEDRGARRARNIVDRQEAQFERAIRLWQERRKLIPHDDNDAIQSWLDERPREEDFFTQ